MFKKDTSDEYHVKYGDVFIAEFLKSRGLRHHVSVHIILPAYERGGRVGQDGILQILSRILIGGVKLL